MTLLSLEEVVEMVNRTGRERPGAFLVNDRAEVTVTGILTPMAEFKWWRKVGRLVVTLPPGLSPSTTSGHVMALRNAVIFARPNATEPIANCPMLLLNLDAVLAFRAGE